MILATLSTTRFHSAPAYQIWWESAHPRRRNGTLMKSKMASAANLFLHTKFEPNPYILDEVMAIFQKSKITTVRHSGIVMMSFETTHVEYVCNIMSVWKFQTNKLLSFEDIKIFIFSWNSFEFPIHAPIFEGFWRSWPPKCDRPSYGPPKNHILAWFRVIWATVLQNRPLGHFSRRVREKNKNKKEEALYFTYLARRFLTADLYQFWVTSWSHGRNQLCKVLS